MPTIYKASTPVGLASGELADFSFYFSADTLGDADTAYAAWSLSLATNATWKLQFTTSTHFEEGTVSSIDEASGAVISTVVSGTAYAGSDLGSALPPQCSTVITLRTDLAGKSNTGRFYLPGTGVNSLTVAGRISSTTLGDLITPLATAFTALKAPSPTNNLLVYSRTLRSSRAVTVIQVGDVVDTQRRRRDKLIEARVSSII